MTHPASVSVKLIVIPHYSFAFLSWYNNFCSLAVFFQIEAVAIFTVSEFLHQKKTCQPILSCMRFSKGAALTIGLSSSSLNRSLILRPPGDRAVRRGCNNGLPALGCQFNPGDPRSGKTWKRKTRSNNCFSPLKDSSQLLCPYLPVQIKPFLLKFR